MNADQLQTILAGDDATAIITAIKDARTTEVPDASELLRQWDPLKHDVMFEQFRKKRVKVIQEEERNIKGEIIKERKTEAVEVNRIPLPIEQDIVNTHVAFTLGTEPALNSEPKTDVEKDTLSILKSILSRAKAKYINKKSMRAWLSEKEVAEYWYLADDATLWAKILKFLKIKSDNKPTKKFKVTLWSPFLGDSLYPVFDEYKDLIGFGREYKVTIKKGTEVVKFMFIDKKYVYYFDNTNGWIKDAKEKEAHGFDELPVVFMDRSDTLCEKIQPIRKRLETLMSNYADCLDYNFAPKLVAEGSVEDIVNAGASNEIIELSSGGKIAYLTWQQTPDMAKLEFDYLLEAAYQQTNTARLTLENLKGLGDVPSGSAFRMIFMGSHMAVQIHAETVELYLQRRINFLLGAIGKYYPKYKDGAETLDVQVEIIPFIINDKKNDVELASTAVAGGIMSPKTGIAFIGLTDNVDEEYKQILEANNSKAADAVPQPVTTV